VRPTITAVLIGPFAPPIHGVTMSNGKLVAMLEARGQKVLCINISGDGQARGLVYHLIRLSRALKGAVAILFAPRNEERVYEMSVDGGTGLVYNILLGAAVRLRSAPLALFHHSTRYIVADSRLMRLLLKVVGPGAMHIACSPVMFAAFRTRYGVPDRFLHLSNAVWLNTPAFRTATPQSTIHLAYLSALREDKGVLRAIATLRALKARGVDATLAIAGGSPGPHILDAVTAAQHEFGEALAFKGPISDEEKSFFADMDYYLFPSLYPHETQSSAAPEAIAMGLPVIAFDHRFVGDLVRPDGGHLIDPMADYANVAADWIAEGHDLNVRAERSRKARVQDARNRTEAAGQLDRFLAWMTRPD